ncbi:MFS transporter [Microbacterium elymi]|uniref:MFS transporter n=1 Tax=Microbacterium elymi TaxID=2909587 RepID=A0ABY5NIG4_9MICO|nr:MFS transporter [Microbacterium elymi]UUT34914.1 MFS transporter [Microbacterium elymi]
MTDSPVPTGAEKMNHRQVLEALSGLILGMFVSMLASTVVSSSLPVIIHDLNGNQTAFTWVVTATLLTTAITTPIWGKLADLFNRKFLYQLAIVIFVLSTAAAGFSQNPEMLITFRAFQGIGAGGLAALSQVLMADILSPRERGKYMGLFGAVMAVATVGGPLLGGVLTDAWGWRWNFYVALPIAIVALILVQKTLHLSPHARRKVSIDYLGIVLLAASVSLPAHLGLDRRRQLRLVEPSDHPHGRRRDPRHDPVHHRRDAREGAARPALAVPQPHVHPRGDRLDRDRDRHVRRVGVPEPVHASWRGARRPRRRG